MNGTLFQWLGRTFGIGPSAQRFWASWAGANTWAGETVTADRAMTIAAVWRAIRLTAETIATLPFNIYERGPDGAGTIIRDANNPYDMVLRVSPNSQQTPVEFWEGMVGCILLVGDGLAHKQRVGKRLVGLTLMDPARTVFVRNPQTLDLTYRYTDYNGKVEIYPAQDVFHVRGFGFGGDRGMSAIQFGANSLSSTLAADKVAGKMFQSGLSSSGFLETAQVLNEPDRKRMMEIMSEYQGSDNAGKLMILEGGMKYTPITMTSADAQLLTSRGFNIEEVGRWFGMPPILLGHSSAGQTMWGTGIEQIIQAWYTLSLRAMITRIEAAISKSIFENGDNLRYYAKFAVEGLLRGDSTARAALYASAAQNGWMKRNEIRVLEELPKDNSPGADQLTVQVNLVPIDQLGTPATQPAQQADQLKNAMRRFLGLADGNEDVVNLWTAVRQLQNESRRELPPPG